MAGRRFGVPVAGLGGPVVRKKWLVGEKSSCFGRFGWIRNWPPAADGKKSEEKKEKTKRKAAGDKVVAK